MAAREGETSRNYNYSTSSNESIDNKTAVAVVVGNESPPCLSHQRSTSFSRIRKTSIPTTVIIF